mmetsp:Transcript_16073/g.51559  ORF Transcript_16073/g.51559 Transcript_16073/m.51559 type:complete len:329 (-) Transcript_16073:17-1003(-)
MPLWTARWGVSSGAARARCTCRRCSGSSGWRRTRPRPSRGQSLRGRTARRRGRSSRGREGPRGCGARSSGWARLSLPATDPQVQRATLSTSSSCWSDPRRRRLSQPSSRRSARGGWSEARSLISSCRCGWCRMASSTTRSPGSCCTTCTGSGARSTPSRCTCSCRSTATYPPRRGSSRSPRSCARPGSSPSSTAAPSTLTRCGATRCSSSTQTAAPPRPRCPGSRPGSMWANGARVRPAGGQFARREAWILHSPTFALHAANAISTNGWKAAAHPSRVLFQVRCISSFPMSCRCRLVRLGLACGLWPVATLRLPLREYPYTAYLLPIS